MPDLVVASYSLLWRPGDNKGSVILVLQDRRQIPINADSAQELAALAAILNEAPVFFRTEDGSLFTGVEDVGGTG